MRRTIPRFHLGKARSRPCPVIPTGVYQSLTNQPAVSPTAFAAASVAAGESGNRTGRASRIER